MCVCVYIYSSRQGSFWFWNVGEVPYVVVVAHTIALILAYGRKRQVTWDITYTIRLLVASPAFRFKNTCVKANLLIGVWHRATSINNLGCLLVCSKATRCWIVLYFSVVISSCSCGGRPACFWSNAVPLGLLFTPP